AEYRRRRADLLAGLQWWLRDVWLKTMGASGDLGSLPQLIEPVSAVANRISSKDALENLQVLERTQRLLHTNVQEALALEVGRPGDSRCDRRPIQDCRATRAGCAAVSLVRLAIGGSNADGRCPVDARHAPLLCGLRGQLLPRPVRAESCSPASVVLDSAAVGVHLGALDGIGPALWRTGNDPTDGL